MKAREIAELVGGELHGDGEIDIDGVAGLAAAGVSKVAFVEKETEHLQTSASCLIVPATFSRTDRPGSTLILVRNPRLSFARVAAILHPPKTYTSGTHASSVIASTASIGRDVFIGEFVCVGESSTVGANTQLQPGVKIGSNVSIGEKCVIHSNVVIADDCTIGNEVTLHAGVVIGADGFGYVRDESGEYIKFPQIGTVVIEDNVEIGANTCVDRGALGETRIGAGTKIDNLVQVGHNVQIGKRCVIAAQTGISGSTVIEDDCVIGGQVGFGDHAHVKSGAIIGSQAGVLPGKIVRPGVWWGTPIQALEDFKRQNAHMKGLERLKSEVKELKKRVAGSASDNPENA